MIGDDTGTTFRQGQEIELKLSEANLASGALKFELPEGKYGGAPRGEGRKDRVRGGQSKAGLTRGRPANISHQGRR